MKNSIHIYFPTQYPRNVSPSQRYRMEQFEYLLLQEKIVVHCFPFIGDRVYPIIFKPGFLVKKIFAICWGFVKRILQLFTLHKYDLIFINREASPLGPPIFEWLYAKVFRKKIVYDFDDAIWLAASSEANKIAQGVKALWKTKYIIKWSAVVIGGNQYLCDYAKQFNQNTHLIPTVVDTNTRFNKTVNQDTDPVVIGWTGSFSTMPYLERLLPTLQSVAEQIPFRFILISNKEPEFDLPNLEYVEWTEDTEVEKLAECQIGIMPMARDEWALGKCGFKIIQYMSLGIVPIADDWGVNAAIIDDGKNGLVVGKSCDWESVIKKVLINKDLRQEMALKAQQKARQHYSVEAVFPKLLDIIKTVLQ